MKSNRQSFLWLAIGTILMLFSNGRWIIPFATWLYPIFFLRFMHIQKPARGFIFLFLASAVVNIIIWWKMIPAPINVYFIITGLGFQTCVLSFLADRILATRFKGFLSTLVFPVAWCTIEYLMSLIPSKGTWIALAYTQAGNLSLMQLTSVTGIWGISFLITWFASAVNWAWHQNFEWDKISRGAITFTSIAVSIFLFGAVRVNFFQPQSPSVLTASIVQARNINKDITSCKWTDAKAIGNYSTELENNLLEKTQQAAKAGAKIVLWQECTGFIPKQREDEFIKRAMALAAQEKIYLLMTLWSIPEDFPKHLVENKLVIINPDGTKQLTYIKSNPVSVEPILKGDGIIPSLQTPYGKIAPAICFDDAFQNFIRQAGKNKVEIMFIPANDWKAIDPIHTHMAITRAIENGFSLARPAGPGLSVATDNRGKIISSMDFFTTDEQVMYADVPAQHSFTIYAQVGDVFAWLCIVCFIIMTGWIIFRKYFVGVSGLHKKEDVILIRN
jgi:apolipoprotein N-acyltransferase